MIDTTQTPISPRRTLSLGCLGLAVMVIASVLGGGFYWKHTRDLAREAALIQQEEAAEEAFDPALDKLSEGVENSGPDYDIDKTVRVIHSIDKALEQQRDLESYLQYMAMQDYRGVAPEVLQSRREIMEILLQLYGKQTEAEDQQAMWEFTSELLLSTFAVVQVEGDVNPLVPTGSFAVDKEQAQELLADLKAKQADRKQLMRELNALEGELFTALMDYSKTYYTYVGEWDQLSVLRDRAYLAARNGDWEQVESSASMAIAKAPYEKEAHLLQAMAIIEQANPERDPEVIELLDAYVQEHPESSAPAFLLLGRQHAVMGRHSEAVLALQQSAAYYPKQAEQLTDMLDPYKMRSFLRKSREGTFIIEQYKGTMLGAGYFSPDLQLAQVRFDRGEFEEGRRKVLDHFARRRAQQQWDFVISDIEHCHQLLGPYFREIFPEDAWLDLIVNPSTFGSSLNLAIDNRSDRTLHNATLILALHLTDMQPGDYEPLTAEATMPAVLAHDKTSFGSVEVAIALFGTTKGVQDIVHHRAILVSNEAVVWVDTDEYRISEAQEFRELERAAPVRSKPEPSYRTTLDKLVDEAATGAELEIESKYGKDHVLISLPKELSILKPIFRLKYGDQLYSASDNLIEGDEINLRFKGVGNFDEEGVTSDDLELVVASPFGDVVLDWSWTGDLSYRLEGARQE